MDTCKLNFKSGNPGAVQFGNFINYYQFHPPENRLKLLPQEIWPKKSFHGLDLGCNAGDLTVGLHNFLKEKVEDCHIVGVDIDPSLIERASEKNPCPTDLTFLCLDFMEEAGRRQIKNYLEENNLKKFDAVFCFSLTMWIHLNSGDAGLKIFLKEVCDLGNLIVVEPQPWKCYRTAVKRMRSTGCEFPLFKQLKIRDNVETEIEQFLVENCGLSKTYQSCLTEWGRKLLIFK